MVPRLLSNVIASATLLITGPGFACDMAPKGAVSPPSPMMNRKLRTSLLEEKIAIDLPTMRLSKPLTVEMLLRVITLLLICVLAFSVRFVHSSISLLMMA